MFLNYFKPYLLIIQIISINFKSYDSQDHKSDDFSLKEKVKCLNLDQEYLENLLSQYQIFYRRYEESLLRKVNSEGSSQTNELNNNIDNNYVTQSQCNIEDRNTTTINRRSICPWQYRIKLRSDRYPHLRTEVICTCDTCNLVGNIPLEKSIYTCLPVLKPMPVLVRDGCGSDGYFKYIPMTEDINVACICGVNKNFISHGKR